MCPVQSVNNVPVLSPLSVVEGRCGGNGRVDAIVSWRREAQRKRAAFEPPPVFLGFASAFAARLGGGGRLGCLREPVTERVQRRRELAFRSPV
jgi:hypothetical protein